MRLSQRLVALPAAALLGVAALVALGPPASAAGPSPAAAPSAAAPSAATAGLAARRPFPGRSPRQILVASAAAVKSSPSFHVTGFEKGTAGRIDVDVHVSQRAAYGTYSMDAGSISMIRIGNTVFAQYDAAFIESQKLPSEVDGKWVRLKPNGGSEWNLAVHTMSPTGWATWIRPQPVSRRAGGPVFTGVPTVRLDVVGPKGGQFYVAASGPAYLRYARRNDGTLQYALFEYGRQVTVDEPPQDEIIDQT